MADIEARTASQRYSVQIEQVTEVILDYCPEAKVVLISRTVPKRSHFRCIELRPLDEADTRVYINAHPDGGNEFTDPITVEQIYRRSEGVPMHLDRLLRILKVLSLSELLELELERHTPDLTLDEPAPAGLVRAIETLKNSPDRYARRSYRLLQILSLLPYGETFTRIRRFDPSEPLFPRNIEELLYRGLIQPVRLFEGASTTTGKDRSAVRGQPTTEKKLVVPRQVRDYVQQSLSDDEVSQILSKAAELYFGTRWWEGKGKLPELSDVSDAEGSEAGAGNPHIVAFRLLRDAIRKDDHARTRQILHIAESYCGKLLKADLYRSACEALAELLHLLDTSQESLDTFTLSKDYGRSLRMVGRYEEAVTVLRKALESGDIHGNKSHRAEAFLSLSLSLQTLDETDDAIEAARQVKALVAADSALDYQASSIIVECSGVDEAGEIELRRIEQRARQKGHDLVANNIALELAGRAKDPHDANRLYRRVMDGETDPYNRMRGSIDFAEHLHKQGTLASLSSKDRKLLNSAYALGYSQRLSGWLDGSHRALWKLFELEHNESALLRLFRYSSFVWRIYGKRNDEERYLRDLVRSGVIESAPDDRAVRSANREKAYAMLRVRRLGVIEQDQLPSIGPDMRE